MRLKKSHFCNSWQSCSFVSQLNRIVLRKLLLSHTNEVSKSIIFLQGTFHTHIHTLFKFLLYSCQYRSTYFKPVQQPLSSALEHGGCIDNLRCRAARRREYFSPCFFDYFFFFLHVYLIFKRWLLEQRNGIRATPSIASSVDSECWCDCCPDRSCNSSPALPRNVLSRDRGRALLSSVSLGPNSAVLLVIWEFSPSWEGTTLFY